MPKLAATLASLLLIASSIGVNIARYPQVGRSIEPGRAEAAEAANVSTPAATSAMKQVVAAENQNLSQSKSEPSFATAVAPRLPAADPLATSTSPAVQANAAVPIVDVRPMVPVASLQPGEVNNPSGQIDVRRLPPVETSGFAPADAGSEVSAAIYPTTLTP